jgi:hypothetical protein
VERNKANEFRKCITDSQHAFFCANKKSNFEFAIVFILVSLFLFLRLLSSKRSLKHNDALLRCNLQSHAISSERGTSDARPMSLTAYGNAKYVLIMSAVYAKSTVEVVFINFPIARFKFLAANRRRSVKDCAECHFIYTPYTCGPQN